MSALPLRLLDLVHRLIQPHHVLVLDAGTVAIVRALPATFQGTIVTASMLVATELVGRPGVRLVLSGGRVCTDRMLLHDSDTSAFFAGVEADLAFVRPPGIDPQVGLTDRNAQDAVIRAAMVSCAGRTYALADTSSLGTVEGQPICRPGQVAGVITGDLVPRVHRDAFAAGGMPLVASG